MKQGITSIEAEKLLSEHGQNIIVEQNKRTLFAIFVEQLSNFLVLLLVLGACISFVIGHYFDGSLILTIVILNTLFGVYQEKKASDAIAALKELTVTKVRVVRDGKQIEIDSRGIVRGDVVFLEEGSKVPGDGVLLDDAQMEVNESTLTGESAPVAKAEKEVVYMGTIVSKGKGYVRITETGMNTRFGKIASTLSSIEETKTPLQKKLLSLSRTIGIVGIILSVVVFTITITYGHDYLSSFLLAVSLAVALAPEALPAVMTITLAVGVKEMATKKAVIRRLSAIEALGNITLIATDKTGTLTTNHMSVVRSYINSEEYVGEKFPPVHNEVVEKLLLTGVLCSTASLIYVHHKQAFDVLGDPTEGALLQFAKGMQLDYEKIRQEWKVVSEIPFDSITKKMSTTVTKAEETYTFTKGAFEAVLAETEAVAIDGSVKDLNQSTVGELNKVAETWARDGFRVLAFSYREGETKKSVFLGMVALQDPPRPEVVDALIMATRLGIKTVMITGDNEKTAEAIGSQIGLLKEGDEIMTGAQIEEYSDEELLSKLPNVSIFARTNPFQKSRIVGLYQRLGEVVAVTGDGVNDAIALKKADVGIAMGKVGTDVAREAADMVITDDNFATIITAVHEGKNIIRNLKNSIKYLLSTNLSEGITLIASLVMGIPNLLYPVQLLFINLVGDGLPALSLAFSPRDEHMTGEDRSHQSEILSRREVGYIISISIMGSLLVFVAYYMYSSKGIELARTAAFSVLAIVQSFVFADLWLSNRSAKKHLRRFITPLFLGVILFPIAVQFLILKSSFLASVFNTQTVSTVDFIKFVTIAGLITVGIRVLRILNFKF